MKFTLLPLVFWLVPASAALAGNSSIYTAFDLNKCKQIEKADGFVYEGSWRCKGIKGYDIFQAGMDERSGSGFGKTAANNCSMLKTFSPFNTALSPIEWRMKGKKPIAAIERWSVMKSPDSQETVTWLVVNKLENGTSCQMHYVSGSFPSANDAARKVADEKAESFNCETDKPTYDSTIGEPPIELTSCSEMARE